MQQFLQEQVKNAFIKIFHKQVVTSHSIDVFLSNLNYLKTLFYLIEEPNCF